MAAAQQEFACRCGALRGTLAAEGVKAGTRVQCYCKDCRANELYHNLPDPLPGPVDLFQTTPDHVTISQGGEHLRLMRLGPKGLLRWYAGCCRTPLANTLAKPTLPFVGFRSDVFADKAQLGKVKAIGFIPQQGKPPKSKGAATMALGLLSRMATCRLSGRWRNTPFFDVDSGQPVADAVIPSKQERAALTA